MPLAIGLNMAINHDVTVTMLFSPFDEMAKLYQKAKHYEQNKTKVSNLNVKSASGPMSKLIRLSWSKIND